MKKRNHASDKEKHIKKDHLFLSLQGRVSFFFFFSYFIAFFLIPCMVWFCGYLLSFLLSINILTLLGIFLSFLKKTDDEENTKMERKEKDNVAFFFACRVSF